MHSPVTPSADTGSKPSKSSEFTNLLIMLGGAFLFCVGVNFFVTPLNLYNGGAIGVAQLIRSILIDFMQVPVPEQIDISGILYLLLNVPLMYLAYRGVNLPFFIKTSLCVAVLTAAITLIPIPKVPIIADTLTSCIVGGLVTGAGIGLCLRCGGSGGGLDIVGVYMSSKYRNFSVGKISIFVNIVIYALCAILFSVETAIYSVIYVAVFSITLDKFHYQNIMVQVTIFTKVDGVPEHIMKHLYRGVTEWKGDGAYTQEETNILVTAISKYEIPPLRKLVLGLDPKAFIIYNEVSSIDGNFIKKL